jgi:hypothetical protein
MSPAEQQRVLSEIAAWLAAPENADVKYFTVDQVMDEALSTSLGRTRQSMRLRLHRLLCGAGWERRRLVSAENGSSVWGFKRQ